jgi:hypothetical protein
LSGIADGIGCSTSLDEVSDLTLLDGEAEEEVDMGKGIFQILTKKRFLLDLMALGEI